MDSTLTREEREILEAFEKGTMRSVATPETRKELIEAARSTFKKDKRVNIRMSGKDLELLQERALKEGLPYQTLLSSVLHKFAHGRLVDSGA